MLAQHPLSLKQLFHLKIASVSFFLLSMVICSLCLSPILLEIYLPAWVFFFFFGREVPFLPLPTVYSM